MNIATSQNASSTPVGASSDFKGIPVEITNNLTVPIDIYDVFNPASVGQTVPYLYTKLGTIAAGAKATVTTIRQVAQLEAMYTGPIAELQGWYYYQFPIKFMSGTQFTFGNPPPLKYTVETSDWQSMIQSFLFHKFAMANPDSALTKNLYTALKSGDPNAVNTFFAGTQNFKTCTMSSWNAIMTWLMMFTSSWQGPYYLYEAAPNPLPQGYVPTLVGTVNIVSTAKANSATLSLATLDSNGKVQPLNPPRRSTVVMAGDGTMTDQNPGQDVTLSLTPVWMNVIQTTMDKGVPTTSYISGPTLTGTLAGKKVVSSQTLIPLPGQPAKKGQASSTSNQSFNTLCQVVGLIVGLAMLAEMIGKRATDLRNSIEKSKAEAKSESDFDAKTKELEQQAAQENADTINKNAEQISSESSGVADGYAETSQIQQKDVMTQTINEESQNLQDQINNEIEEGLAPTQDFENAFESTMDAFQTAQSQIENGQLKEASSTMSDAATSMQEVIDTSAQQMQQSEVDVLSQSSDAVDMASRQADAMNDAQEEYEENSQNAEDDSGFSGEDEVPEVEPLEGI